MAWIPRLPSLKAIKNLRDFSNRSMREQDSSLFNLTNFKPTWSFASYEHGSSITPLTLQLIQRKSSMLLSSRTLRVGNATRVTHLRLRSSSHIALLARARQSSIIPVTAAYFAMSGKSQEQYRRSYYQGLLKQSKYVANQWPWPALSTYHTPNLASRFSKENYEPRASVNPSDLNG